MMLYKRARGLLYYGAAKAPVDCEDECMLRENTDALFA